MSKLKRTMISNAIARRLEDLDGEKTAYSVATECDLGVDTVYSLRDGRGARIESINAVLDSLGLVIVPRDLVAKRGLDSEYVGGDPC